MKPIYLDNNATTPVAPEVLDAMLPYFMEQFGNPSSVHRYGVMAERAIKESRQKLASIFNVKSHEIIFTSGGTEAANFAIKGIARAAKRKGNHIISSPTEHEAVLESLKQLQQEGFEISFAPPDSSGLITPEAVKSLVKNETILIAIMHANNELGTINPIEIIGKTVKNINPQIKIFSDGVQAFGKCPIYLEHIDAYSMSGHKIHAPKGIGALILKEEILIQPLISGGGQEFGKRSGTENVPGIIALTTAAELADKHLIKNREHFNKLKYYFMRGLNNIDGVFINTPENSLENTLNISIPGNPAEVIIHALEQEGIFISAGAACHGTKRHTSHVLEAIKLPPQHIQSSLRFSFSRYNTLDEIQFTLETLQKILINLKPVLR